MNKNKNKMILCPGGQKCGTTWLFDYFNKHPEIGVPSEKELRVFDSALLPYQKDLPERYRGGGKHMTVRNRLQEAIAILQSIKDVSDIPYAMTNNHHIKRALEMMYVYTDMEHFTSYMDWLEYKLIGKKYVSDITPTYILLDDENTGAMAGYLRQRFDVKVVYLIRDPIDRLVSWMHMINRLDIERLPVITQTTIMESTKDPVVVKQQSYSANITRLYTMFGKENVYVDTMERFITEDGVRKFSKWIDVEYMVPDISSYHNAHIGNKEEITSDTMNALRKLYHDEYVFCEENFNVSKWWINFNGK